MTSLSLRPGFKALPGTYYGHVGDTHTTPASDFANRAQLLVSQSSPHRCVNSVAHLVSLTLKLLAASSQSPVRKTRVSYERVTFGGITDRCRHVLAP